MKQRMRIGQNPSFDSVTGLTNRNFNPASITEGQMVTEEQLLEVYERIVADEKKADACCRDIVFWEARTQIVRLNTNKRAVYNQTKYDFNGAGVVISSFDENVNIGSARRGTKYTVRFPIKWDNELYYPCTPTRTEGNTSCSIRDYMRNLDCANRLGLIVQYRYTKNAQDVNPYFVSCASQTNNRANFFDAPVENSVPIPDSSFGTGNLINPGNAWGSFIYNMENDGTVTITDNRANTDYSIIRFYTQWTLNKCADGTLLSNS